MIKRRLQIKSIIKVDVWWWESKLCESTIFNVFAGLPKSWFMNDINIGDKPLIIRLRRSVKIL